VAVDNEDVTNLAHAVTRGVKDQAPDKAGSKNSRCAHLTTLFV
jgi:hypothetical protein